MRRSAPAPVPTETCPRARTPEQLRHKVWLPVSPGATQFRIFRHRRPAGMTKRSGPLPHDPSLFTAPTQAAPDFALIVDGSRDEVSTDPAVLWRAAIRSIATGVYGPYGFDDAVAYADEVVIEVNGRVAVDRYQADLTSEGGVMGIRTGRAPRARRRTSCRELRRPPREGDRCPARWL